MLFELCWGGTHGIASLARAGRGHDPRLVGGA